MKGVSVITQAPSVSVCVIAEIAEVRKRAGVRNSVQGIK
jgi:hypothetical protein